MELDWIRRSGPGGGTLNVCFNALDRHVVRGHADELAVLVDRRMAGRVERTFAQLLEDVAAFGGVLRALGVGPGGRVLSRLPMGMPGLVATLAAARVGAVLVVVEELDDPAPLLAEHRPGVVLAEGTDVAMASALAAAPEPHRAAVWRGRIPDGHELGWDDLMRAGRTDPAAVAEVSVEAEALVVAGRTLSVAEVLADDGSAWPLDAVGTLVAGGTLLLSVP